ncbi:hypothetical protein R3P38DRAFT_3164404 [Favolaschia claudopus]|uniref:Uncharacterized protein n=1 Tax=Favolaschia claudopus TaxID=2862362 RepID=A0AAW0EE64_9AGAR
MSSAQVKNKIQVVAGPRLIKSANAELMGSNSPHLLRHVRELNISRKSTIHFCSLPFTHLETLSIHTAALPESPEQLQPLLCSPNLRKLTLATFDGFSSCLHFLSLCPTVRDLRLSCKPDADHAGELRRRDLPLVLLEALFLKLEGTHSSPPQKLHASSLHPIDLSNLKALHIWEFSLVAWDTLPAEAHESIRILDINFSTNQLASEHPLLSSFENLVVLRLGLIEIGEPDVHRILASISKPHRIQRVIIGMSSDQAESYNHQECWRIDTILLSLALSRVAIEFEFEPTANNAEVLLRLLFPHLAAGSEPPSTESNMNGFSKKFSVVYSPAGVDEFWQRDLLSTWRIVE